MTKKKFRSRHSQPINFSIRHSAKLQLFCCQLNRKKFKIQFQVQTKYINWIIKIKSQMFLVVWINKIIIFMFLNELYINLCFSVVFFLFYFSQWTGKSNINFQHFSCLLFAHLLYFTFFFDFFVSFAISLWRQTSH